MGIRDFLNKNKPIAAAVGVVAIGVAILDGLQLKDPASDPELAGPNRAFFTTDDGKTTFVDDAKKVAPFSHDGKTAVRARMFRAGKTGKPFIGYLERVEPTQQPRIAELQAKSNLQFASPDLIEALDNNLQLKAPGGETWFKITTGDAGRIQSVKDPTGSAQPIEPVNP